MAAFDFQEPIEIGAGLEQNTDSARLIVVLGLVLAIFGVAYVLPVGCSIIMGDGLWLQFIVAAAINTGVGLAIALATVRFRRELKGGEKDSPATPSHQS